MLAADIANLVATRWPVVAILAVAFYFVRNYFFQGLNKLPGPFLASVTNWWRFYHAYKRTPEREYRRLHDKYGDIVRIGPDTVSFSNPEAVKQIYALNNGFTKSDFYPVHVPLSKGKRLGSIFATQDEKYHAMFRRSVAHAFSMSSMVQYEARVTATSRLFLDETAKTQADSGKPLDLTIWLQYFAFDVIHEVAYSKPMGFIQKAGDIEGILAALDKWFRYIGPIGQIPALDYFLYKNPIWSILDSLGIRENSYAFTAFAKNRVDERIRSIEEAEAAKADGKPVVESVDLVTQLRKSIKDRPEFFTYQHIVTVASSLTTAGSDTTAITLAATFYYLAKNPRIYNKLNEELEDAARTGVIPASRTEIIPWAASQKLPYLDACIKETFRIHSAVAFHLERVVPAQGAVISGEFIPGGTIVGCNAWMIHKRKEVFGEDVDTFRPERWLADPQKDAVQETVRIDKMVGTLFHFGAGSRSCLGRHITLLELYKLIPSFLRRFDVQIANPDEELRCHNAWFIKQLNIFVTITSKTAPVEKALVEGI